MTQLKILFACITLTASAALPLPTIAKEAAQDGTPAPSKPSAPANLEMTDGEVRKVDKDAGKITIKHAEVRSLEMPPMTMVFTVQDPALLDKAKAGDKVQFNVVRQGGKFVVTAIQTAK